MGIAGIARIARIAGPAGYRTYRTYRACKGLHAHGVRGGASTTKSVGAPAIGAAKRRAVATAWFPAAKNVRTAIAAFNSEREAAGSGGQLCT